MKIKNAQTITKEFSKSLTSSKKLPNKVEKHRGTQFKIPSRAEQVIRTIMNLLNKPIFEKGSADWLSELPPVIETYNKTKHHSMKMTPNHANRKFNEKAVFLNLQDKRQKQKPKFKKRQLVRTADIKKVFSKGDSINYSYELYTVIEVLYATKPSY